MLEVGTDESRQEKQETVMRLILLGPDSTLLVLIEHLHWTIASFQYLDIKSTVTVSPPLRRNHPCVHPFGRLLSRAPCSFLGIKTRHGA